MYRIVDRCYLFFYLRTVIYNANEVTEDGCGFDSRIWIFILFAHLFFFFIVLLLVYFIFRSFIIEIAFDSVVSKRCGFKFRLVQWFICFLKKSIISYVNLSAFKSNVTNETTYHYINMWPPLSHFMNFSTSNMLFTTFLINNYYII